MLKRDCNFIQTYLEYFCKTKCRLSTFSYQEFHHPKIKITKTLILNQSIYIQHKFGWLPKLSFQLRQKMKSLTNIYFSKYLLVLSFHTFCSL